MRVLTAVRWLARAAARLVLAFAFTAAALWVYAGPRDWAVARLVAVAVVIIGAGLALSALRPRGAS